jgi:ABC-2 type transport system permease protein
MARAWVVAVREYLALVGTKAFVIGLLMAPLILGLAVLVGDGSGVTTDPGPGVVAVVDASGSVLPRLQERLAADGHRVQVEAAEGFDAARRAELAAAARKGEIQAIVEIEATPEGAPGATRIYVDGGFAGGARWLDAPVDTAVGLARLGALGVPEPQAQALMRAADIEWLPLPGADGEASDEAALARVLAPMASVFLVFIAVMTASMPLLQAVVEEKQQRIAEVLLGAVSPFQLMAGKLLGAVGVVLTTLVYYVGLGWLGASYLGLAGYVSPQVVATVLVVASLASVLYGALFLAVGAAASDLKDAQGMMTPLMVLLFAPLIFMGAVTGNPHSPLAVGLSLFPLTAPMFLPMRVGLSDSVPTWQIALALVFTLTTLFAVLWAAGRIFRIGILSHGRMPGLRELARWLRA